MSITPMALGCIIAGMGLVTYSTRMSLIMLLGRVRVPEVIQRALRFVPPTVLSAIIFPELLVPRGTFDLSFENPRLLAGLLAAFVVWWTRNVFLAITGGMLTFWLLQAAFAR